MCTFGEEGNGPETIPKASQLQSHFPPFPKTGLMFQSELGDMALVMQPLRRLFSSF